MTDISRAELSNGIWLCKNCHGKIDDDEVRFPATLIFRWRSLHEEYVASSIGKVGAVIRMENQREELAVFSLDPPIVRQLLIDRPNGWQWRVGAALVRSRTAKPRRKLQDLAAGLYTRRSVVISEHDVAVWLSLRFQEAQDIVTPAHALLHRLMLALPNDEHETAHICDLFGDFLYRVIEWEEEVRFANVPGPFKPTVELLKGIIAPKLMGSTVYLKSSTGQQTWLAKITVVPRKTQHS